MIACVDTVEKPPLWMGAAVCYALILSAGVYSGHTGAVSHETPQEGGRPGGAARLLDLALHLSGTLAVAGIAANAGHGTAQAFYSGGLKGQQNSQAQRVDLPPVHEHISD